MADPVENIILKKLEEYGDSFIEDKSKKKKRKERKEQRNETDVDNALSKSVSEPNVLISERQKKRRRKKKKKDLNAEETNLNIEETEANDEPQLSGHEKMLKEMSEQLGLGEFKSELKQKATSEVEQVEKSNQPEVVVFTSHKSKRSKKGDNVNEATGGTQAQEFDMRQARFDVQKLGIKGFQGDQKEMAMTALLMKLGAKPPKNKYVNYKEYQENRKKEMQQEKMQIEKARELGNKVPKASKGKKRPQDRNDIGLLDGQIGKWKAGVQILKKDDVKKFKKPRLK